MSKKPVRVRFAPSPTGHLHVGNLRTAIINWLFCRQQNGTFILRFDDTDKTRSKNTYKKGIEEIFEWLGLDYDETFCQFERIHRYHEIAEFLKKSGRLYPCFETSEELEFKRKKQLSQGLPPIYDRSALKLTSEEIEKKISEGQKPHWRFQLTQDPVHWFDLVRGPLAFEHMSFSDPVFVRADGIPVYTLASITDDLDYGITHIIRGEDHIANTAVQIQLIDALGYDRNHILFAHMPLICNEEGKDLSKREGSLSALDLQKQGFLPLPLLSLLAHIGTSTSIKLAKNKEELIESFSFNSFARGTPKFSFIELKRLNSKYIHELTYQEACILHQPIRLISESFWDLVRPNLTFLPDALNWWESLQNPSPALFSSEEKNYLRIALETLSEKDTFETWISNLKKNTQRQGKHLFQPIRKALTGCDHGPELSLVLKFLGKEKIQDRLLKALESHEKSSAT